MKKKRPVLQDVADLVSVTKMMVSRYLRNPEQVSEALRDKIAVALGELGYIPDRAPGILSNTISHTIGVLLPLSINQVFSGTLRGIESVTSAFGYQTMLAHHGYKPEMEERRPESMLSQNIDGLILIERTHTPRTLKMIEVAGVPVVKLMGSRSPCLDIAVESNNSEAARQMTAAIIARGHRHIAYLGVHLGGRTIIKQKGYEQTMLDTEMTPYSVMVEQSSPYSSGIELMRQARREYPQLDGIFCANDDLAVGAAFECQHLGLKIPDDMTVAGFHSRGISQVMEPHLASVLTPRERVGRIDAGQLLVRIRGEATTPKMLDLGFTSLPGGSI